MVFTKQKNRYWKNIKQLMGPADVSGEYRTKRLVLEGRERV